MRLHWWGMAAALVAGASTANAGYTPISYRPGGNSSERNQAEIMARFFGNGTFNTTNFTSAAPATGDFVGQGTYSHISFLRVQDYAGAQGSSATGLGIPLFTHSSSITGRTDQVWQDGTVMLKADAKFAGYNQRVGYKLGDGSVFGASNPIADVTSVGTTGNMKGVVTGVSVVNGAQFTAAPGTDFRLTRSGNGSSYSTNEWSSRASENGGVDHMITYLVSDTLYHGPPRFLIFFDDQGSGSDRDFNDFAMTLTIAPLPPAGWAGISTLVAAMGFGYIRRRRFMQH